MFKEAISRAAIFTQPVIISHRTYDGTVSSGLAAFINLNEEGWILTCAHVFEVVELFNVHQKEKEEYDLKKKNVDNDRNLNIMKKSKGIKKLNINNKWITNYSYWWGWEGISFNKVEINRDADLALAKLENYNPGLVTTYPTFINPNPEPEPGTFLCKLGYPFYDIATTYNEDTKSFKIQDGVLPVPRFPLEGMHTRYINNVLQNGRIVKMIETSSPGLRGQSGGPIFDSEGNVWAIQSRTVNYNLGFSPEVKQGNKSTVEHQFLNVGVGVYVSEIKNFLDQNNVKYNMKP